MGRETTDRIFKDQKSYYRVTYYASEFSNNKLGKNEHIYVINSFAENFDLSSEAMSNLLADQKTRKRYDLLIAQFSDKIQMLIEQLSSLSGTSKNKIKDLLIQDLNLTPDADWTEICEKLKMIDDE